MTGVAVVGFAAATAGDDGRNDAELLAPVVTVALEDSGLAADQIDVVVTAGSEFLGGVVGGVMGAFDAFPGWPPRTHSHLEGDGAFGLYEAWVRLLAGEGQAALVCAFSRPLAADRRSVLELQLDPYTVAPLRPCVPALAALQARALIESGRGTEEDLARVVAARRPGVDRRLLGSAPYVASPLREPDCSTVVSGAAAVVLATEARADAARRAPAWISGAAHRMERHYIGARDLTASPSTRRVARDLGVAGSDLDVLEIHAPFSHQELIIEDAVAARRVGRVNPSGGALPADPIMATGLIRIGHAADAVMSGQAGRAVGHATNGPCLQHNLLVLMESRDG
jgi:acetyl-CoA acetyltransferase